MFIRLFVYLFICLFDYLIICLLFYFTSIGFHPLIVVSPHFHPTSAARPVAVPAAPQPPGAKGVLPAVRGGAQGPQRGAVGHAVGTHAVVWW